MRACAAKMKQLDIFRHGRSVMLSNALHAAVLGCEADRPTRFGEAVGTCRPVVRAAVIEPPPGGRPRDLQGLYVRLRGNRHDDGSDADSAVNGL